MREKIEHSIQVIKEAAGKSPSAVMLSFGKDSMVLAHLIRAAFESVKFPVPVIFHRTPWFPHKHEFANHVIQSWGMEVHDWKPMHTGIKVKDDLLELVSRYNFGNGVMDLPVNTIEPYPRRDYVCGLNDWIEQPKSPGTIHKWRTIFHGHKSSDVDQFEGHVPLNAQSTIVGGIKIVFPLKDWTDSDIWDYIETNHVPYQKTRYENRSEIADKWLNPDYINACTRCIDPRNPDRVMCPKVNDWVDNRGHEVIRLQERPEYIG